MAASILRSFGDGKSPLIAMLIAALLNVGLDLLFVLAFHWGVFGAAIASVTAQLFSFLFCVIRIRKVEFIKFEKDDWKFDGKMAQEMLAFGLPIALQMIVIAISGMVAQSLDCYQPKSNQRPQPFRSRYGCGCCTFNSFIVFPYRRSQCRRIDGLFF